MCPKVVSHWRTVTRLLGSPVSSAPHSSNPYIRRGPFKDEKKVVYPPADSCLIKSCDGKKSAPEIIGEMP